MTWMICTDHPGPRVAVRWPPHRPAYLVAHERGYCLPCAQRWVDEKNANYQEQQLAFDAFAMDSNREVTA